MEPRPRKKKVIRANPLARRSLSKLVAFIRLKPIACWPRYLAEASKTILAELDVDDTDKNLGTARAREILIESIKAAHRCVTIHNHKIVSIARNEMLESLRKDCGAIATCLAAAPAPLRKRLDHDISKHLDSPVIDAEVLEPIFKKTTEILNKIPTKKNTRRVREAIKQRRLRDFVALHPEVLQECYTAVAKLAFNSYSKTTPSAARVFRVLSETLRHKEVSKISSEAHSSIVQYMKALARIWRKSNLKVFSARSYLNDDYQPGFLRFANLVYAAIVEPPTVNRNSSKAALSSNATSQEEPIGPIWLIGDSHVRKVLAASTRKQLA